MSCYYNLLLDWICQVSYYCLLLMVGQKGPLTNKRKLIYTLRSLNYSWYYWTICMWLQLMTCTISGEHSQKSWTNKTILHWEIASLHRLSCAGEFSFVFWLFTLQPWPAREKALTVCLDFDNGAHDLLCLFKVENEIKTI